MKYVIKESASNGCGSFTIFAVNFDTQEFTTVIRVPWNDASADESRVLRSRDAAKCVVEQAGGCVYGTVPTHFRYVESVEELYNNKTEDENDNVA